MTELLNKLKQTTLSSNGGNGFLNRTMTINTLATSKTNVPVDVTRVKEDNLIVDEEDIELPEYEKLKVVGRGGFFRCNFNSVIEITFSDAGSFGVAILYNKKSTQSHVVLKQINLINLTKMEKELAMNEVEVFSKLHHPNIIWWV